METNKPNVARITVNDETLAYEIFARVLPEIEALPVEELIPVNLDVPVAITTSLGALPEILALRDQIANLPHSPIRVIDGIENYAFALSVANSQYLSAVRPADDLEELTEEGTKVRETLALTAEMLAHHGLIDKNTLNNLQGPNGYRNLASDLGVLSNVLRDAWPNIQGKCAIEFSEIERATKLGQRLMRVVGLREQGPAIIAKATDVRNRAFTLLTRAYDEARRAVTYLRWHDGDVDRVAPSLYAGRSNGRRKASSDVVPPVATPAATPPNASAGTPAAAGGPGVAAASTAGRNADDGPFVDQS
jgi:hypothetical protein